MGKASENFDRATFRQEARIWLETQDQQTCVLIAARAAMRITPLLSGLFTAKLPKGKTAQGLIFPSFWAIGTTLFADNWPNRVVRAAADAAAYAAADAAAYAAANAADAAAYAADAAAYAVANAADAAAYAVANAAANAVYAAAAAAADAFNVDKAWVEAKPPGTPITDLCVHPLWPDGVMSGKFKQNWQTLKAELLALDNNWQVWTNWYEDRLAGKPLNQDLELAIANLDPEEYWNKGAKPTNAKIQELIEEHTPTTASRLEALQQMEFGAQFEEDGDHLKIRSIAKPADFKTAQSPEIQRTHDKLKQKARDFAETANRLDNQYGWTGIGSAAKRFADALSGDTPEVAERIRDVWEEIVELGTFLEQDDQIRADGHQGIDILEPNYRRALNGLLQTGVPWLREFPTARKLDDEIRAHKAGDTDLDAAHDLISASGAKDIINNTDRETLLALVEAAKRGEIQGEKAKTSISQSGKNLVISIGKFCGYAVATAVISQSALTKKGIELFQQNEKIILRVIKDAPADIRVVIQGLLKEIADKEPPPHSTKTQKPKSSQ